MDELLDLYKKGKIDKESFREMKKDYERYYEEECSKQETRTKKAVNKLIKLKKKYVIPVFGIN